MNSRAVATTSLCIVCSGCDVQKSGCSLVMDVDDSERRLSQASGDHEDHNQISEHHNPNKQYTVMSLPQSEHAELATTVLNSSGPKINCQVTESVQILPDLSDWP